MATAELHTRTNHRTKDASVLDAALEESAKRQSITASAAAVLGVEPSKLCGLLRNVWRTSKGQEPLTDQEMFQGISLIARYELDPIAKEIYVTRTSKGLVTIIGIDGWIKVLDRTDHYDGFDVELHSDENGKIDYVDTKIFSKKRAHPTTYRAYASEYSKVSGFVAGQMPTHMLRIFGLRHAARLFTPIGGNVMTEEEALYMQQHAPDDSFTKPITDTTAELTERIASGESPEDAVQVPDDHRERATRPRKQKTLTGEIDADEQQAILEAERGDAAE